MQEINEKLLSILTTAAYASLLLFVWDEYVRFGERPQIIAGIVIIYCLAVIALILLLYPWISLAVFMLEG